MSNMTNWLRQLHRNAKRRILYLTQELPEDSVRIRLDEVSRVAIPADARGRIIDYNGMSYFMATDFGTTYDGATVMMSFDSNGAVVEPMPKDIEENEPVEMESSPDITIDADLKDE